MKSIISLLWILEYKLIMDIFNIGLIKKKKWSGRTESNRHL